MRVLYVVDYFPHATESYIETEIHAARALGVDVHLWTMDASSRFPHPTEAVLHAGTSLAACIEAVRPDLVHIYFLIVAEQLLAELRAAGLPATVRVHGFENSVDLLKRLAADPAIARVFVFPHMANDVDPPHRPKTPVLPTMYNPEFYRLGTRKDPRLVVRAASALMSKSIELFLAAARLCPEHRFVLALGQGFAWNDKAAAHYKALNAEMGHPVELRDNLDWGEAARLFAKAAIYMYTPPLHRPGMPVSIAEAMASGCLVLAPAIEGMADYVGPAGGWLYATAEDAATQIRASAAWSEAEWNRASARAAAHAARHYASDVVAPKLVAEWQRVVEEARAARRARGRQGLWRRAMGAFVRAAPGRRSATG